MEEAIYNTCYAVADTPGMGHRRVELSHRNILFVPVTDYTRYVIAYVPDAAPVRILRVMHGARNIPKLFG